VLHLKRDADQIAYDSSLQISIYILARFSTIKHFDPAERTKTLGGRFAILDSDALRVPHFFLGYVFDTICFHLVISLFVWTEPSQA
jgi:hypothetical protein